jgi:hypothetical protein
MDSDGRTHERHRFLKLLIAGPVILGLCSYLLSGVTGEPCSARAGTAAHLISQLDQAAEAYQLDCGVYPPGDGTGSRALVEALSRLGRGKRNPYFEFPADLLTTSGDVVNPVGRTAIRPSPGSITGSTCNRGRAPPRPRPAASPNRP